jgi:hypothetical protein
MKGIRRPFSEDKLYVVGEAYSGNQGWVKIGNRKTPTSDIDCGQKGWNLTLALSPK